MFIFRKYLLRSKQLAHLNHKRSVGNIDQNKLRNIGILAHIDAGKTTTTERMLYYSGTIQQMGEVHHGNTVTDYMEQERERGITITSAAVSFNWKGHQFNLIDTPGHIDFTAEVEQTLNVLDGSVVILDASAGVEAQTLTVWRQANQYRVPRIVYCNKMDRGDANLDMCCKSIEKKFEVDTLCLQLPLVEDQKLIGLIDVLSMEKLVWDKHNIKKLDLKENVDGKLWEKANEYRLKVIDKASEYDDELANNILSLETLDNIKTVDTIKAIREIVLKQKAVPMFCGSSYKNIGVQPLMDAVILYLPSPTERNKQYECFSGDLCARAFKVIHHKQRGPLVFFRIYSGKLSKGQKIFNAFKGRSEQIGKLLIAYADDFKETDVIESGNIAVVTGLKETRSGDMITTSSSALEKAKKRQTKAETKNNSLEQIFGSGPNIPEPVFFCSIEPPSLAYQVPLETALIELQREDPSLKVTQDSETGQTVLAGMGELHLEIIKDRILKEYKIEAELGPLQIAYREEPIREITGDLTRETLIAGSKQLVTVKLSLLPKEDDDELLKLDKSPEAASNLAHVTHKQLAAIKRGIEVGLLRGPKLQSQVTNTQAKLHYLMIGRGTSESMVTATVTQLVQKLLSEVGTHILEPMMHLEVVVPENYVSVVMADLSRRRCTIDGVGVRGNAKVVSSETPLSELMGYSTTLRTITSGTAAFTMEFCRYSRMTAVDEENAIQNVRGF